MNSISELLNSYPEFAALALVAEATWAWEEWDFRIRPMFVSKAEIDRMADALLTCHGKRAAEVALIEVDSAWRRADSYRQGVWVRVRRSFCGGENRDRASASKEQGVPAPRLVLCLALSTLTKICLVP